MFEAVGLKVGWQVLVGLAPLVGADDPEPLCSAVWAGFADPRNGGRFAAGMPQVGEITRQMDGWLMLLNRSLRLRRYILDVAEILGYNVWDDPHLVTLDADSHSRRGGVVPLTLLPTFRQSSTWRPLERRRTGRRVALPHQLQPDPRRAEPSASS